jgi:outer membrane protein assembly factor BamE
MSKILLSALLAMAAALAACSSNDTTRSGLLEAHRYDLPQGNYVTQEMLTKVKVGMSKLQVRRALGSPLLTDVFKPNRWNYVFSLRHPSGRVDLRKVVVQFNEQDKVATVDADPLPPTEDPSDPALPGFNPDSLSS